MPAIFISYRRDDMPGVAGRLADALVASFGADNVFRDIEDIAPGADFAAVLREQLDAVGVMLVLIGPTWLTSHRNGVRRLDESRDYVRLEIEAGLQSGKPVLPVLIGGAAMPSDDDLPDSIRALASRQAFVLSDLNWASDAARMVDFIASLVPAWRRLSLRRRLIWGLAGVGLIALLMLGLKLSSPNLSGAQPGRTPPEIAEKLSGRWMAQVKYDWGAVHEETFEFRLENGGLRGSASYLRLARSLERGTLIDGRIEFITHSQEIVGDGPVRDLTHRYRGAIDADGLHLVLETTGGYSMHSSVAFVARRVSR